MRGNMIGAMEPEPLLGEIAETFLRFVTANPDMAVTLHVRVGDTWLELGYRARELAAHGALASGIREVAPVRATAQRMAVAVERR